MKVYCKNCALFYFLQQARRGVGYRHIEHYCDPEKTATHNFFGWPTSWDIDDMAHCEIQNENNNCRYYKRKWWKFWVKDN